MRRSRLLAVLGAIALPAAVAFGSAAGPPSSIPESTAGGAASIASAGDQPAAPAAAGSPRFVDVTAEAGIRFVHNSGRAGKKLMPEPLGPGAALFDADGDGWLDIFLVNGRDWTPQGRKSLPALYRNDRDGTFTDVTRDSGLDVELYGLGAAAADYDNDGRQDLYVTALEGDRLFHNEGDGRFRDVTAEAGIRNRSFGTSAAWLDYDRDGRLDLFVANYVEWAPERDLWCSLDGKAKSYCTPESYKGTASVLYRNVGKQAGRRARGQAKEPAGRPVEGAGGPPAEKSGASQAGERAGERPGGRSAGEPAGLPVGGIATEPAGSPGAVRFVDVSREAGIADATSKSLGVAVLDYDGDGWPDLFLANDTQPNKLYRNLRNGRFAEEGLQAGVAFGEDGAARGAMGVDAADYDRSGRPHLVVGNFSNEMLALYHNEGSGVFVDQAPASPVGRDSRLALTFGAFFFDYDLDGLVDIFTANGHLEEEIERVEPRLTYRQPPLVFRNLGKGRFSNVTGSLGPELGRPVVARGAAHGDVDRDGDLDVLLTTNHGPAYLFRNDGGNANHWLQVRTVGTKSNRDGIGAVVRVTTAAGKQWAMVKTGSSYCSQSDLVLTFGLGKDVQAEAIEIEWPSEVKQKLAGVAADQLVTIEEGKGIVASSGPARPGPAGARPSAGN